MDILTPTPISTEPVVVSEYIEDPIPPAIWVPDIIVVGPGGSKGYYEIGMIKALDVQGLIKNIKHYVGVSVGAIICLLLTVGYSPDDIIQRFLSTDMLSTLSQVNMARDIRQRVSLFSNRSIISFLTNLVTDKLGFVPSLKDLSLITDRVFTAVTLNLSQQTVEYINRDTEPSMSCIDAVALSINIPGIFEKITYRSDVYVDGALGNPYPVDAFDDGISNVLGISILTDIDVHDTLSYLSSNIDCSFYHMHRIIRERSSSRCKHLYMCRKTSNLLGVNLAADTRMSMINEGVVAANTFYTNQVLNDQSGDIRMTIKSTFPEASLIEEGVEVEEVEFPSINEVISGILQDKCDSSKLIKLLHILIDWVDTVDVDSLINAPLINITK